MEVKVLKFGGSILKDGNDFERVADVIEGELEVGIMPVCVVSAMKGVTDRLVGAVEAIDRDNGYDVHGFVQRLYDEHLEALTSCEPNGGLRDEFDKLEYVLSYVGSSGELNDSAYAFAVSRGENFSCRILERHLLSRGVACRPFGGEDLLITDEDCRDAFVDLELSKERISKRLGPLNEDGGVPIVAGFAGRSCLGRVSILGRGGSDDTAVCVAYCLGAREVVKYVDQDGVMTVDPRFIDEIDPEGVGGFPAPRVVPYLSYVEASELMREERIKVVHYKVLNPLIMGDIRFHVRPIGGGAGTVIGPEDGNHGGVGGPKAISFQRGLHGIRFLPTQSRTPTEVYARVFEALSGEGVDVRYISISGYQISLLMPGSDLERGLGALRSLDVAMDVTPMAGLKGTFSIVGSGMRGVRGLPSRVTGVVARHGVNIEQATQPYGENIIRFSVDDGDIPLAVGALYSEFFGGDGR